MLYYFYHVVANWSVMEALDVARHIVDVLEEHKAENIILLDLRPDTVMADFFVIANGNSERQIKALMDHVRDETKEKLGLLPASGEGKASSGWVLLDYGDVVVHLFHAEQREYYNIEGLLSGVANVLLSIQ